MLDPETQSGATGTDKSDEILSVNEPHPLAMPHSWGQVWLLSFHQSSSGFLAAMCYTSAGVTSSIVANQLSITAGAAYGYAAVFSDFFEAPCFMGINTAIGICIGQHNKPETARVVGEFSRHGILYGLILAAPAIITLLFAPTPILTLLQPNIEPEILHALQSYYYSFVSSTLIRFPLMAGTIVPWATLNPWTGLCVDVFYKGILQTGFNFLLGLWLMRNMTGLGFAPLAASAIMTPAVALLVTQGKKFKQYHIGACSPFKLQHLTSLFKYGMPFVTMEMLMNLTRFIRILLVGKIGGKISVAALGVAEQIAFFADSGHLEGAAQNIVSNAFAHQNHDLTRKLLVIANFLGAALPLVGFAFTPKAFLELILPTHPELINQTRLLLQWSLGLMVCSNLSNIGTQILSSQGDIRFPTYVNVFSEVAEAIGLTLLGFLFSDITLQQVYMLSIAIKGLKALTIFTRSKIIESRNASTDQDLERTPLMADQVIPGREESNANRSTLTQFFSRGFPTRREDESNVSPRASRLSMCSIL